MGGGGLGRLGWVGVCWVLPPKPPTASALSDFAAITSTSTRAFDLDGEENYRETRTLEACQLAHSHNKTLDHFP
jgi:hypothetical protein